MSEYEPYDAPGHDDPATEYPADHPSGHDDNLIGGAIGQPLFDTPPYEAGHETGQYEPSHEYDPSQYDAEREQGYDPEEIAHRQAEAGYQEPTYAGEGAYVQEGTGYAGEEGSSAALERNPAQ